MWLADDAVWITLVEQPDGERGREGERETGRHRDEEIISPSPRRPISLSPQRGIHLRLSFPGANPDVRLEPFDRQNTRISYFIGDDPAQWQAGVPVWGGVRYVDLYPGVDLEITGEAGRWSWRLMVRTLSPPLPLPGGGSQGGGVRLHVEGADDVAVDDAGILHLATDAGNVVIPLLVIEGARMTSPPAALAVAPRTFDVIAPFVDSSRPAPRMASQVPQDDPDDLLYATFLGGSYDDNGRAIAVDDAGDTYVSGSTLSADFPATPGAFDTSHNLQYDVFVVKLNSEGTGLIYGTFLGGSDWDEGHSIDIDETGAVYLAGGTRSADFPTTPGAFDTSHNGEFDIFVVKVNADGGGLVYATYLGGSGHECHLGCSIATGGAGEAYVTGFTLSPDFPTTPEAFDRTLDGGLDAFVARLDAGGANLAYGTFLGGTYIDAGYAVAVDGAGHAFVAGWTTSRDFPVTPGAFDTSYNGDAPQNVGDVFVVKLGIDGSELIYATYLGGQGGDCDFGCAIAVDGSGSAYVTGSTSSSNFPTTPEAFNTSFNGGMVEGCCDAFASKLNSEGTQLVYSSYLGGSAWEEGRGIVVDEAGNAYISGWTHSSNFPVTRNGFDTSFNGDSFYDLDAFLVKLNPGGTDLAYGSFLGGTNGDQAFAVALNEAGAAYVTGRTWSDDFPTMPGAFDTSFNGGTDVFVAKLRLAEPTAVRLTEVAVKMTTQAAGSLRPMLLAGLLMLAAAIAWRLRFRRATRPNAGTIKRQR